MQEGAGRPIAAVAGLGRRTTTLSVLMVEISPSEVKLTRKSKRRHVTTMFHGSGGGENKEPIAVVEESTDEKGGKKSSWGFNGLEKWKKAHMHSGDHDSNDEIECIKDRLHELLNGKKLEVSPTPNAKRAKKKHHATATGDVSASD
ncbi:hypothetical protein ZWY2020_037756 [Hordeum vulgare]|nr:hypothetical protein ZWY2020_037756 [Hordeum vulgare]